MKFFIFFYLLLGLFFSSPAGAQTRVLQRIAPRFGNDCPLLSWHPAASADGRFISFSTACPYYSSTDTNNKLDILLFDRLTAASELISSSLSGTSGAGESMLSLVSLGGEFVAFDSGAADLVSSDTNDKFDVFVRNRLSRTTERVSIAADGAQANGSSSLLALTPSARYVVFSSNASNLVPGDNNAKTDIFVRDRAAQTTERVSISTGESAPDNSSDGASISADGRFVAFGSTAANLTAGDTNNSWDIFLRDRQAAATELISVSSSGLIGNGLSWTPAISGDGRFVVFESVASNLTPNSSGRVSNIFLRDRLTQTTSQISRGLNGAPPNGGSNSPRISSDGRLILFYSMASNLTPGDTNNQVDLFALDRTSGELQRVGHPASGAQPNSPPFTSAPAALCGNGSTIVFASKASNLVPGDKNDEVDLFLAVSGDSLRPAPNTAPAAPRISVNKRRVTVYLERRPGQASYQVQVKGRKKTVGKRTSTPVAIFSKVPRGRYKVSYVSSAFGVSSPRSKSVALTVR